MKLLLPLLLLGSSIAAPVTNAGEDQVQMVPVAKYVNRPETEKDIDRALAILRDHQINTKTEACFGATMSVPATQAASARELLARAIKTEGLQLTLVELTPASKSEPLQAADKLLIPAGLNAILPKIHAGMTVEKVATMLVASYPGVKKQLGDWSGTSGYVEYKLDERYTLGIAAITRDGKEIVHEEMILHLYDWPEKRRVDLKIYDWEKEAEKNPAAK